MYHMYELPPDDSKVSSITETKAVRRMGYPVLQKVRKKKKPSTKGFGQYKK